MGLGFGLGFVVLLGHVHEADARVEEVLDHIRCLDARPVHSPHHAQEDLPAQQPPQRRVTSRHLAGRECRHVVHAGACTCRHVRPQPVRTRLRHAMARLVRGRRLTASLASASVGTVCAAGGGVGFSGGRPRSPASSSDRPLEAERLRV